MTADDFARCLGNYCDRRETCRRYKEIGKSKRYHNWLLLDRAVQGDGCRYYLSTARPLYEPTESPD